MQSIVLLTLLISAVCALEMHRAEVTGKELEESSVEIPTEELPGKCWACKWVMKKVKKQLSNGSSQDEIKNKLLSVCDQIGFLKSMCKSMLKKYIDTLVEELSTNDDPAAICANIGLCKK